jgi:hypothetical protein
MKTMTIRNVPPDLATALDSERRRRGLSLNRTVLELMRQALGLDGDGLHSNGLRQMAGTWSEAEFRQFEKNVAPFARIDDELWR